MNCNQVEQILIDYLYGELAPKETAAVKVHLEECPGCAAEIAELGWARNLAADLPDPEPSRLTMNKIIAHAREDAEKPKGLFSFSQVVVNRACHF